MIPSFDYTRRDNEAFQFAPGPLRQFVNPDHLLLKIERAVDLRALTQPLLDYYCPDNGRNAVHPEIIVRALLIGMVYQIPSFRRLCWAISENLAYRYFCHLTLGDPVFDHSTISRFIERVGQQGFEVLLERLNEALRASGLLEESEVYMDSTVVKANVDQSKLVASGKDVKQFRAEAEEANGLYLSREVRKRGGLPHIERRAYQDKNGKLPLSEVDPDARWRKTGKGPAVLGYKAHVAADRHGFILAVVTAGASQADYEGGIGLLRRLPYPPGMIGADSAYSCGAFRAAANDIGAEVYAPIRGNQWVGALVEEGFRYEDGHVICPEGKQLRFIRMFHQQKTAVSRVFGTQARDCESCPSRDSCLPPKACSKRVGVSVYYPLIARAAELNKTGHYRLTQRRRRAVIEGVNAHLKALGLRHLRLNGLSKVGSWVCLLALCHNIMKAVSRRKPRGIAKAQTVRELRGNRNAFPIPGPVFV